MCHCPYPQLWKPRFREFDQREIRSIKHRAPSYSPGTHLFEPDCGKVRASLIAQLAKNLRAIQESPNLTPGTGTSVGEGIGHPLQYFWASIVTQLVKSLLAMRETLV